ncbi:diacylglycerol kinase family lipid kinase [uncultured Lactobacillus sp.]|uniref:diacylglycerol/lipid kinase family protein n=1 Tax=uncultured Lactobacillus sp. TaxID=153152 RepID=UPI00280379D1|nr:diacylglycerol kinase family lipid kinase [uncultured Lactobacillus sp.]
MSKQIRVHLLVNETAGNGNAKKANAAMQHVLNESNISFTCQKSRFPKELTTLAKNYANTNPTKNDILIVIGGDGSFNEVLNGIKTSNYPETPITYLPAGTGNDFARGAGLTADPRELIHNLLNDPEPEQVDCGYFSSNIPEEKTGYFVNNFGIGFDAFIVYQSNHEQLKEKLNQLNLGNFIYGLNVIKALAKQDTFAVTVKTKDQTLRYGDAYFVTTTNHPYFGGGFAILPKADVYSHHLDTVIVEKPSLSKFIFLFSKLLKDGSHVNAPQFHYVEAKEIQVETRKPEFAQIDGEDVNKQSFKVKFKIDHFNLLK